MQKIFLLAIIAPIGLSLAAQNGSGTMIDKKAAAIESKVIDWRHHLHQHPELSNREFETAKYVVNHLKSLGLEIKTGVAHTGVVGILNTGKPGPTIALRADMDALPVAERVDIPFASKAKGTYVGQEVGVMHACGHDTHVAMLMGAAEILVEMKDQLKGKIVFIFQPAEEGAPPGERGGAGMMVEEGVLDNPKVEAIFGLHINSATEVGKLKYKPGGELAAADIFNIRVKGKQTHGSTPWTGIDPIVTSAQIIMGLQTIISRQTELTKEAAVISVGKITSGVRNNIIPEEAEMTGTIRTLDTAMQRIIHDKIRHVASTIAESADATAEVEIIRGTPVTYNNPSLTAQMLSTMERTAGKENVILIDAITGAEDFAFYAQKIPGLFIFVGGMPKGNDPKLAPPHHTPDFYVDDKGMQLGVRLLCNLAIDYLNKK
ncbi:MAG: amidohydrolase [Saprospiraceae bacterium]|nr:amidohydrolase [Saprospiraceae bacterium]